LDQIGFTRVNAGFGCVEKKSHLARETLLFIKTLKTSSDAFFACFGLDFAVKAVGASLLTSIFFGQVVPIYTAETELLIEAGEAWGGASYTANVR
jgi:hypothetical protein